MTSISTLRESGEQVKEIDFVQGIKNPFGSPGSAVTGAQLLHPHSGMPIHDLA